MIVMSTALRLTALSATLALLCACTSAHRQ